MAFIKVQTASAALTLDGTANGYATVSDNSKFPVGAIVYLTAATQPNLECIVTDLQGSAQVGLRQTANTTSPTYGRTNISTYTVANAATLTVGAQTVISGNDPQAANVIIDPQPRTTLGAFIMQSQGQEIFAQTVAFTVAIAATTLDVSLNVGVVVMVANNDTGGVSRTLTISGITDTGVSVPLSTTTVNTAATTQVSLGFGAAIGLPRRISVALSAGTGAGGTSTLAVHSR